MDNIVIHITNGWYDFTKLDQSKNYIKLKTTHFNIVNTKDALVGFFKNLKKLKQHHFGGEVFNSQLVYQTTQEAA